tara:strand:+ start:583 stop:813 length:231 start_codon:yes stop_codon:yes gene_type:complete
MVRNIIVIAMILTLSSCMVSQKAFDEKCNELNKKCCALESEVNELKTKADGFELKEQLLRQAIYDLKAKQDSAEIK